MNKYFRRLAVVAVVLAAVLLFSACAKAPDIDLPPIPTYSDETPAPTAAPTPVPTSAPTPTPASSEAPISYIKPVEESAEPSPVPTVQTEVPFISISGETLPEDMVQYNVATLHGHVSTDKGNVIRVWASLLDGSGNTVQECSFNPAQASFSLAGTVNAQLRFAELQPGDYTYVLSAEAENLGIKTQKELIRHSFTVFSSYEKLRQESDDAESAFTAKISQDTDAAALIWNFLAVYLDNPYGAAGILGNIDVESQCNPQRVQGDLSTDFFFSESYTQQVDEGNINRDSFIAALAGEGYGSGYGLCQWSFERKAGLYDLAQERGSSVGDLDTQCMYIVMELEIYYPELLELLRTTDDARLAAREFFYVFEQGSEMGARADLAEDYLIRFAA